MKKATVFVFLFFCSVMAKAQSDTILTVFNSYFIGEIVSVASDTITMVAVEDFAQYSKGKPVRYIKIMVKEVYSVTISNVTPAKQALADALTGYKELMIVVDYTKGNRIISNPKENKPTQSVVFRDPTQPAPGVASYYFIKGSRKLTGGIVVTLVTGLVGGVTGGLLASKGKSPVAGYIIAGAGGITGLVLTIDGITDFGEAGRLLDIGRVGSHMDGKQ